MDPAIDSASWVVRYTASEVAADIDGPGLLIERVERPAPTPDSGRVALDVLVRAGRLD